MMEWSIDDLMEMWCMDVVKAMEVERRMELARENVDVDVGDY